MPEQLSNISLYQDASYPLKKLYRVETQLEELLSSNEDVDMVDTIIKYRSMQAIYNASLSAAAQSVQTTLLDFL